MQNDVHSSAMTLLCVLGTAVIFMCMVLVMHITIVILNKLILQNVKNRYRIKHRYPDITLEAKCFCKDCIFYGEHHECTIRNNWMMKDNDFCSKATPKTNITKK